MSLYFDGTYTLHFIGPSSYNLRLPQKFLTGGAQLLQAYLSWICFFSCTVGNEPISFHFFSSFISFKLRSKPSLKFSLPHPCHPNLAYPLFTKMKRASLKKCVFPKCERLSHTHTHKNQRISLLHENNRELT